MSETQKNNTFAQAVFTKPVWQKAGKVMDLYERGELKGQRLSRKGLISKPEFKQQYFAAIQSLPQSFQLLCLAKVAKKEYSLEDLKKAAKEFRSMQTIQKAFCRCTNTVTWEEACDRFPHFTDSVRLRQLVGLSFKPIPEAFQAFCRAALQMSQSQMKPQVNIASMVAEHMLSRPTLSCYHILTSRRHVHYTLELTSSWPRFQRYMHK